jgi:hypothetical protein
MNNIQIGDIVNGYTNAGQNVAGEVVNRQGTFVEIKTLWGLKWVNISTCQKVRIVDMRDRNNV